MKRVICAVGLNLVCALGVLAGKPANSVGTGGNWSDPTIWSTSPLIPLNDEENVFNVKITGGTVNYDILETHEIQTLSLETGSALNLMTGRNLTVVEGVTASPGSKLVVEAGGFTAYGGISLDGASLKAVSGGLIKLPDVSSLSATVVQRTYLTANDPGSKIELPNLSTFTIGDTYLNLEANNGGHVELPSLNKVVLLDQLHVSGPRLKITTNGPDSVISMPHLSDSIYGAWVTMNGGSVDWGSPKSLNFSQVYINASGSINLTSISNANGTSFTASGGASISLPQVTQFQGDLRRYTDLIAKEGSVLSFPSLTSVTGRGDVRIQANGPGAVARFPSLTTIDGEYDDITVIGGGLVDMPNLTLVKNDYNTYQSHTFNINGKDSLLNAPLMGSNSLDFLSVQIYLGEFNWGKPTVFKSSSLTIDTAGTIPLEELTNIDSSSFTATNGASIVLPKVTMIKSVGIPYASNNMTAKGSHSCISLATLRTMDFMDNIVTESYGFVAEGHDARVLIPSLETIRMMSNGMLFSAKSGGTVKADGLKTATQTSNGNICEMNVYANGLTSKVLLSSLSEVDINGEFHINATQGGVIDLSSLETVKGKLNATSDGLVSRVNLSSMRSFVNASLVISNDGEIDLGGYDDTFEIFFNAMFDKQSTGELDIFIGEECLARIRPNNFGNDVSYHFTFDGAPGNSMVRFVADGSGAKITLKDYVAVPEPSSLAGLSLLGLGLLRRKRAVSPQ